MVARLFEGTSPLVLGLLSMLLNSLLLSQGIDSCGLWWLSG